MSRQSYHPHRASRRCPVGRLQIGGYQKRCEWDIIPQSAGWLLRGNLKMEVEYKLNDPNLTQQNHTPELWGFHSTVAENESDTAVEI